MTGPEAASVAVMLPRYVPPPGIARVAHACEVAGFDELWVVEDCFYSAGPTSAAIALAATSQITVGIGILPAVVRNPLFTAMEAATLQGAFGRVHLGLGHGVSEWMTRIGAAPASWMVSLEETTTAVRDLLHARSVTMHGDYVVLEDTRLLFPPAQPPPISLGVRGPKSVALAGRVADGLILAEPTTVEYIAAARATLDAATPTRADGSARPPGRITAYTMAGTGPHSTKELRDIATGAIRSGRIEAHLAALDEEALAHASAVQAGDTELHDDLLARLVIHGSPEAIRAGIRARDQAGADCVVLVPSAVEIEPLIEQIGALGAAATS